MTTYNGRIAGQIKGLVDQKSDQVYSSIMIQNAINEDDQELFEVIYHQVQQFNDVNLIITDYISDTEVFNSFWYGTDDFLNEQIVDKSIVDVEKSVSNDDDWMISAVDNYGYGRFYFLGNQIPDGTNDIRYQALNRFPKHLKSTSAKLMWLQVVASKEQTQQFIESVNIALENGGYQANLNQLEEQVLVDYIWYENISIEILVLLLLELLLIIITITALVIEKQREIAIRGLNGNSVFIIGKKIVLPIIILIISSVFLTVGLFNFIYLQHYDNQFVRQFIVFEGYIVSFIVVFVLIGYLLQLYLIRFLTRVMAINYKDYWQKVYQLSLIPKMMISGFILVILVSQTIMMIDTLKLKSNFDRVQSQVSGISQMDTFSQYVSHGESAFYSQELWFLCNDNPECYYLYESNYFVNIDGQETMLSMISINENLARRIFPSTFLQEVYQDNNDVLVVQHDLKHLPMSDGSKVVSIDDVPPVINYTNITEAYFQNDFMIDNAVIKIYKNHSLNMQQIPGLLPSQGFFCFEAPGKTEKIQSIFSDGSLSNIVNYKSNSWQVKRINQEIETNLSKSIGVIVVSLITMAAAIMTQMKLYLLAETKEMVIKVIHGSQIVSIIREYVLVNGVLYLLILGVYMVFNVFSLALVLCGAVLMLMEYVLVYYLSIRKIHQYHEILS